MTWKSKSWLVVGGSSIVTGIIMAVLLVHFVYVFICFFIDPRSRQAFQTAQFHMEERICGNPVTEIRANIVDICDTSRALLVRVGPIAWGYWNHVLQKTWNEHYDHLRGLLMWPVYLLVATAFHAIIANPLAFFTTVMAWIAVLRQLLVSLGFHSIQRARTLQQEDRFHRQQLLGDKLQHVVYSLPSSSSSSYPSRSAPVDLVSLLSSTALSSTAPPSRS